MDLENDKLIKELILDNKEMFENILNKSMQQLEQDDFIKYTEACNKYREIERMVDKLKSRKKEIEDKFTDVKIKIERFPLLEKEEFITSEEMTLLTQELECINTVIGEIDLEPLRQLKESALKLLIEYEKEEAKRKILDPTDSETVYVQDKGPMPLVMAEYLFRNYNYKHYGECTLQEKQKIKEYDEETKKIKLSEDEKYDKKGKINMHVILPKTNCSVNLELEITPRQMANAGIIYTDNENDTIPLTFAELNNKVTKIYWRSNEQIALEKRLRENNPEAIKEVLLKGDNTSGVAMYDTTLKNSEPKSWTHVIKAMPQKMFDLGYKYGIGFPSTIIHYRGEKGAIEVLNEPQFLILSSPFSEDVKEREKKVEKFKKKVLDSKNKKYDKKGIISIPKYGTNTGFSHRAWGHREPAKAWIERYIDIEVTQRELAEAGILPEDFQWKEKAKVSPKDIAEASKGLTTKENRGIKGFFAKLLDKFKGKDEK